MDMTRRQFDEACKRRGFVRKWMGYWDIGGGCEVHPASNAGPRYRDQLAYMIQCADRHEKRVFECTV